MNVILVINSGSSSLKFSAFSIAGNQVKCEYQGQENIEASANKDEAYEQALTKVLDLITAKNFNVVAAGHRIVHGGPNYSAPIILNDKILAELLALTPIMPLHQPYNVKGVKVLQQHLPDIPQIGCFDTAFHSTCDPIVQHYALPKKYTDKGLRRYGFHGLSYEYISTKLPPKGKFVVAHLGNGATMCAIKDRKSVATSIGFTGLGGLPMGTRCDSIDPGAVLYLMDTYGFDTERMLQLFYKESGLLGVSGLSADMRDLLASDKPEAKLAVDIFVDRVVAYTGFLAAELEGIDGFVFTGGIGENAAPIRQQVCKRLAWLGIGLDKDSKVPAWVIATNEELMIAQHIQHLIK